MNSKSVGEAEETKSSMYVNSKSHVGQASEFELARYQLVCAYQAKK